MKKCTLCKEEKPFSEFHKQSKTKDGLATRCKKCTRLASKLRYKEGRVTEKIEIITINDIEHKKCRRCREVKPLTGFPKLYGEEKGIGGRKSYCSKCKRSTLASKASRKKYKKTDVERKKIKVRKTLRRAVKANKIPKPTICSICNESFPKEKIHGHHEDYSKPLDVIWCCQACHMEIHNEK